MSKGANIAVPTTQVRAVVSWASSADVDVSALMLDDTRKVRSDADFVFYNAPRSADGSVAHRGKTQTGAGTEDAVEVDLGALPDAVDNVVIAASVDGATFGAVPGLTLRLLEIASGAELARFDITDASTETAFLFGALYRRRGAWKFRAIGQGYASGLAGLATDFGISVEDPEPTAPPSAATPTPPAPPAPIVSLKKQKQISLEKKAAQQAPQLVNLVKKAAVSLDKKGLGEHTARVALCLDISGSMSGLYSSGKIQALVERVLALALRFDDDGEVDVFLFGKRGYQAGTVNLDNIRGFVPALINRYGLEPSTMYGSAMRLVREHYFGDASRRTTPKPDQLPVYAMFVTDGQTFDEDVAREQVRSSSFEALFWQFMAIGKSRKTLGGRRGRWGGGPSEFAFLEELDDMDGRYLDNADFFSVEDPAHISDDEIFDLMVNEYPGWLGRARSAGLLPGR